MNFQDILMQVLMGAGGNYTGKPLAPPTLPGFMQGQPSGMALGGIDPTRPNVNREAKGPPIPPMMPPGFVETQATGLGPEMGPMQGPGPLGFTPPPPMPPQGQPSMLAGPQPPAAAPPPMGQQQAGAGGMLRGLFGGQGRTLYDIFSDTMAGAATAQLGDPGITAFAKGATGARASKKLRDDATTATEDKAWEREGEELDRTHKIEERAEAKKLAPLKRAQTAAEIKDTLDYGKRQKQLDAAVLAAITRDEMKTSEDKIEEIKKYLGMSDQGSQGQAGPPEGYQMRDQRPGKQGRVLTYRGGAWYDEQGNVVEDIPTQ